MKHYKYIKRFYEKDKYHQRLKDINEYKYLTHVYNFSIYCKEMDVILKTIYLIGNYHKDDACEYLKNISDSIHIVDYIRQLISSEYPNVVELMVETGYPHTDKNNYLVENSLLHTVSKTFDPCTNFDYNSLKNCIEEYPNLKYIHTDARVFSDKIIHKENNYLKNELNDFDNYFIYFTNRLKIII